MLARIFHDVSTADTQEGMSTALMGGHRGPPLHGLLYILVGAHMGAPTYACVALTSRALYTRPLAPPRDESS